MGVCLIDVWARHSDVPMEVNIIPLGLRSSQQPNNTCSSKTKKPHVSVNIGRFVDFVIWLIGMCQIYVCQIGMSICFVSFHRVKYRPSRACFALPTQRNAALRVGYLEPGFAHPENPGRFWSMSNRGGTIPGESVLMG